MLAHKIIPTTDITANKDYNSRLKTDDTKLKALIGNRDRGIFISGLVCEGISEFLFCDEGPRKARICSLKNNGPVSI